MSSFFSLHQLVFAQPYFLVGLLALPFLLLFLYKNFDTKQSSLLVSSTTYLPATKTPWQIKVLKLLPALQTVAVALLIIALARPQQKNKTETTSGSGIDIVLSIDISGSMLAQDFTPNRLEVAKKVVADFMQNRPYDRMGLVIFSGESYTQCPLTTDHQILLNQLQNIQSGMLQDGTAIGMGLATAVDRLKASDAKSKIVILLTDGVSNMGLIDPLTALEIAKALKTKVYTIGIGTMGTAQMPIGKNAFDEWVFANEKVEIDEALLTKIATETGGKYYRCTDNKALQNVYEQIDQLEKSAINIDTHLRIKEMYKTLVAVALFLLLLLFIAQHTFLRTTI